jgi:hypothetical protein
VAACHRALVDLYLAVLTGRLPVQCELEVEASDVFRWFRKIGPGRRPFSAIPGYLPRHAPILSPESSEATMLTGSSAQTPGIVGMFPALSAPCALICATQWTRASAKL